MRVKQKLKNLGTRLGSAENLPESLRSQIPEFSVENFEGKILDVLTNDLEGVGTLSEIMIGVYKKYGICDRDRIDYTKHIYVLMRKHLCEKFGSRKGVYKIPNIDLKGKLK